ncbi:glutamyl-tRNA reductase [Bermanella marisrubri]|uniref:Glutamyl-tRNA reductase n=1 Tax=Bermanella marisrubri TaxID=207949 RepID=Q1N3M1_9GAMM|nr:glutamyl-tRNA reductase [Bermanella marisrubri]EAT12853.1 glutamyl-tRNA reductase [Oceanobacter sp. RED65] [Bermanella marisrubri]QIZ83174.1 glutamyl-tRNA reductase [Bermanella marisrubri]
MALITLGINHKTAPVALREKVAFSPDHLPQQLRQAGSEVGVEEIAVLSTCNRTEVYCAGEASAEVLLQWLQQVHQIPLEQLADCHYALEGEAAVQHLMRVASGLDSLILGEPQILGQMKSAYAVAQEAGTVGPELGRLFRQTFTIAKQVRTQTAIGENPVSVAYAAVNLAQRIFSQLSQSKALLIGAGETIDLVARHLMDAGVKEITVANRTLERAEALAQQFNAKAILLSDIPDHLPNADIVISSTAAPLPILGKGTVERALKKRKHAPMFMVDIAVPRDIEEEVDELDDVYLYTVDDLKDIIEENVRQRQNAAKDAEEIIEVGSADFMRQLRTLDAVSTLKAFRTKAERIRDTEVEKALKRIRNQEDAEKVLHTLANTLTNKLIHQPTVQMREASASGRKQVMDWVQELYQLNDDDLD